jgi:hypothetical protein
MPRAGSRNASRGTVGHTLSKFVYQARPDLGRAILRLFRSGKPAYFSARFTAPGLTRAAPTPSHHPFATRAVARGGTSSAPVGPQVHPSTLYARP